MTDSLLLLVATVLLGIVARLLWRGGKLAGAFFVISLGIAVFVAGLRPRPLSPLPGEPSLHRSEGYLGSGACAECHPGQSHSFSQTYHRTMTRRPSELRGEERLAFPARLDTQGRVFELTFSPQDVRRIELVGPDLHSIAERLAALPERASHQPDPRVNDIFRDAPVVRRELVLVTGSHHYLAFWAANGHGEELRQLPFVWLVDEKTWVPRHEAFLAPPGSLPHLARWNGSCIQCHSVAGRPGEHSGKYDTSVAELGISCEGCHGPGEAHTAAMRSPLTRLATRNGWGTWGAKTQSNIFSPTRASSAEASARCGECHAYFAPQDPEKWWESGFVREKALEATGAARAPELPALPDRILLEPERPDIAASVGLSRALDSIFWPDGSVIVGGREYSGLIHSACYARGQGASQLGCLDCHSMHDAPADDQLKPDWQARCTACHSGLANGLTAHSRHPVSVGCADCHMPKTSYALLSAIRSHRITVPNPTSTAPPSACVLCHTSESRTWLVEGYDALFAPSAPSGSSGSPRTAPRAERVPPPQPLALELAISGDALTRALLSRALVSPAAVELSGSAYPEAILQELLTDPYPAVRRIAQRSLDELGSAKMGVRARPAASVSLQDSKRVPSAETFLELRSTRDDRDVTISE